MFGMCVLSANSSTVSSIILAQSGLWVQALKGEVIINQIG